MEPVTPRFDKEELCDLLPHEFRNIDSSELYAAIKSVTEAVIPEETEYGDLIWDFYLPLKGEEKTALIPVEITEVKVKSGKMIFKVNNSELHIYPGNEKSSAELVSILDEIAHFVPYLRQDISLIEKLTPYSERKGEILGKYVLPQLMPENVKKNLLSRYEKHLTKKLKVTNISLDDYFETAAIAYRAIFGKETKGLTPRQMYERWAEGRHGGMLEIVDSSDQNQFTKWLNSKERGGNHPFELLYSSHNYGIALCPPSEGEAHHSLSVGATYLYPKFLAVASALMKQEVAFLAPSYKTVLDYLAGETTFSVNGPGWRENLHYFDSEEDREKYFSHIQWDPLKIPQWKAEQTI